MTASNDLDAQRADLLSIYVALAEFGRKRAERRASAGQHDDDRAGGQRDQTQATEVDRD